MPVALFFMFRKYKKVEKRLHYEMTDVRNIAASKGGLDSTDNAMI